MERQSDENHTILLLDIISLNENISAIIMPNCQPLSVLAHNSKGLLERVNLSEIQCLSLVKQLLEGVNFLHSYNIAHLDIKLDNLVISDGRLYIIDYGMAKQLKSNEEMLTEYYGTKGYIAPEVENNDLYNPIKVDIWSTGMAIYELLTKYSLDNYQKLNILHTIASKLMTIRPSERPLLSEVIKMLECTMGQIEQVEMPRYVISFY